MRLNRKSSITFFVLLGTACSAHACAFPVLEHDWTIKIFDKAIGIVQYDSTSVINYWFGSIAVPFNAYISATTIVVAVSIIPICISFAFAAKKTSA